MSLFRRPTPQPAPMRHSPTPGTTNCYGLAYPNQHPDRRKASATDHRAFVEHLEALCTSRGSQAMMHSMRTPTGTRAVSDPTALRVARNRRRNERQRARGAK